MSDTINHVRELTTLYDMLNAPQSIGVWKVTVFTNAKRLAALEAAIRAMRETHPTCQGECHVFSYESVSQDTQRCFCGRTCFVVLGR